MIGGGGGGECTHYECSLSNPYICGEDVHVTEDKTNVIMMMMLHELS